MSDTRNVRPIVVRRKKVVASDGHHGGAWKVAYADFVTAMMAFFMLMWLLNATTESQRKGLADYFSPTIPVSPVSGGGDGLFGGDSAFSDDQLAKSGKGDGAGRPTPLDKPAVKDAETELRKGEERFRAAVNDVIPDDRKRKRFLEHFSFRLSDEGLVVEVADVEGRPLFQEQSESLTHEGQALFEMISAVLQGLENRIAIEGHVQSFPIPRRERPHWQLSQGRANTVREIFVPDFSPARVYRMTGFGDNEPSVPNRMSMLNNRIDLVLLREMTDQRVPEYNSDVSTQLRIDP